MYTLLFVISLIVFGYLMYVLIKPEKILTSKMMKTEILGVIAQIVLMVALSYPLGKYIAKVYKKEKTWLDFMKPVERLMFRLSGINPEEEMNWKQFLRALLTVNLFWFVWGMVLLVSQGTCPQSGRQRRTDVPPGVQYMHFIHGEL